MPQSDFISYLVRKGALRNAQELDAGMASRRRDSLGDIDWLGMTKLTHTAFADELAHTAFADELATFYRCGRVQRADLVGGRFAGERLSPRFLKEERIFPYEDRAGALTLAIARPIEDETIRAAEIALQREVTIAVATADDIDAALATTIETAATKEPATTDAAAVIDDNLDDLRDLARGAPVVRALDELLRLAVEQRGTDLHIEPLDNVLQVRLRIDGLLKPVPAPPMSMAKGLLSRLKIMAGLNITERRLPQDGRARIVMGGTEVDLRIATMPTMHGESAVIRLLRKGSGFVTLDQVGLAARDDAILRNALQAPFGMIIVTGPTGSGKTTTLAASLAVINEPARKILTIEDPVEYHIKGINRGILFSRRSTPIPQPVRSHGWSTSKSKAFCSRHASAPSSDNGSSACSASTARSRTSSLLAISRAIDATRRSGSRQEIPSTMPPAASGAAPPAFMVAVVSLK